MFHFCRTSQAEITNQINLIKANSFFRIRSRFSFVNSASIFFTRQRIPGLLMCNSSQHGICMFLSVVTPIWSFSEEGDSFSNGHGDSIRYSGGILNVNSFFSTSLVS